LARVAENDPQLIADASTSRRKQARPSKSAVRKRVVEAVKETAAELGNTPAVARNSYIEPSVLSSFEKGEVVEKYFDTVAELVEHEKPTLAEPENALQELLEESAEPASGHYDRTARHRHTPSCTPSRRSARPRGRTGPHPRDTRRSRPTAPGPRADGGRCRCRRPCRSSASPPGC